VPSPLRGFLAITSKGKVSLLEELVARHVGVYRPLRREDDVVFAVVFPDAALRGEPVRLRRWQGDSEDVCVLED